MKYIKFFENLDTNIEIGDYVICHCGKSIFTVVNILNNFLYNNIGRIIDSNKDTGGFDWIVKYDNIPISPAILQKIFSKDESRGFDNCEIEFFSKNKKDLEEILQSRKYNL